MRDLDEPDPALGETSGHEALPAEVAGGRVIEAIEPLRRRRFLRNLLDLRRRRLHPERQLERRDPALERRIGPGLIQVVAIHLLDQVQIQALQLPGCGCVRDERDLRPVRADPRRADGRALIDRRQERRAPVVHAAVAEIRADGDEPRQVLILGPEPVRDPRAHARPDERIAAGVELQEGSAVPRVGPVHRVDHAEVVHAPGQVREQLADRDPALAVLPEPERRAEQITRLARDHPRLGERQGLAIVALQERLVVERVNLRRPAVHEQEDDPLRARREMSLARRQRIASDHESPPVLPRPSGRPAPATRNRRRSAAGDPDATSPARRSNSSAHSWRLDL